MNELKSRGVEDALIAIVDGLKGFPEAITAVFPQAQMQTIWSAIRWIPHCAVHPVPGLSIGPGVGRLSVNGTPAGEARFAWSAPSVQRRSTSAAISARRSATTT